MAYVCYHLISQSKDSLRNFAAVGFHLLGQFALTWLTILWLFCACLLTLSLFSPPYQSVWSTLFILLFCLSPSHSHFLVASSLCLMDFNHAQLEYSCHHLMISIYLLLVGSLFWLFIFYINSVYTEIISHPSLLTACQMALAVTSGLSWTSAVSGLVTHYINAHDHRNLRKEAPMLHVGATGQTYNNNKHTEIKSSFSVHWLRSAISLGPHWAGACVPNYGNIQIFKCVRFCINSYHELRILWIYPLLLTTARM
jgi:hypothetical protein